MRIWAFPSFYPYDYPGLRWNGTFAHRQYKGLIENGADLKVIVPVPWNPPYPFSQLFPDWEQFHKYSYPKHRVYDGIDVYHPRIANMHPNKFVGKSYNERFIDAVSNFFKQNRISIDPQEDIFYSQWLPNSQNVQNAAHLLGLKSAILGIGDDVIIIPKEGEAKYNEFKNLLINADLRFYNADYLGKEANKLISMNLPYEVTYFGVDYDLFKPFGDDEVTKIKSEYSIPDNKVVILNIASPLLRKGWLDLFDALVEIKKKTDNFVFVGGYAGPKDIEIDKEIEKRGLIDNFIGLGEVKPELLSHMYNIADIFCLPSHWEGLATVVMESMSCGVAVITTNVCGHPEIVSNGITGILIPPKRVDILTQELIELINNKDKRIYLGTNARNFIVDKWGNAKDNAGKLYQKLKEALIK